MPDDHSQNPSPPPDDCRPADDFQQDPGSPPVDEFSQALSDLARSEPLDPAVDGAEPIDFDLADAPPSSGEIEGPQQPPVAADPTPADVRPAPGGGFLLRLAGHLFFSALGLVIGYYILCWIDPRGNFLHLPLPGARSPVQPGRITR